MYYPIDKYIITMYYIDSQEATGHIDRAAARKETSLREKVQAPGAATTSNIMEVTTMKNITTTETTAMVCFSFGSVATVGVTLYDGLSIDECIALRSEDIEEYKIQGGE